MQMTDLLRAQVGRDLQRDSAMSDADYTVLVELSEDPAGRIRMTDLATRMMWSKSRLSHQIGRMEARGLVRKEECPSDARGAFATLTATGLAEIQRAAPAHLVSVRRNFVDLLDREQLRQLTSITERVLSHLRLLGASDDPYQATEASCPSLQIDDRGPVGPATLPAQG
jgi:DNA-binding MarR family transcriptional regulator